MYTTHSSWSVFKVLIMTVSMYAFLMIIVSILSFSKVLTEYCLELECTTSVSILVNLNVVLGELKRLILRSCICLVLFLCPNRQYNVFMILWQPFSSTHQTCPCTAKKLIQADKFLTPHQLVHKRNSAVQKVKYDSAFCLKKEKKTRVTNLLSILVCWTKL